MIYLGADHRGFELKEKLKPFLRDLGFDYQDLGASIYNKEDDYPDFAKLVGEKVAANAGEKGILICGSGVGIAVAANKIKGIRAGTILKPEQARATVNDEDLNILSLGADYLSEDEAKEIVKTFLETKFSNEERHKRRIEKIEK
jgi:ribose 5-phosphate isomerase B